FVGLAAVIGPAFSGILSSKTNEVTVLTVTAVALIILGILSFIFLRSKVVTRKEDKQPKDNLTVRTFFQNSLMIKAFSGAFFLKSEEHTSELQSRENLVCRLLLEKKKKNKNM